MEKKDIKSAKWNLRVISMKLRLNYLENSKPIRISLKN
jgi:hypothetical protein